MPVYREDVLYASQRPDILVAKLNTLGDTDNLGDITTLTTTEKTTAVGAINELVTLVTAAEESSAIGTLASLTTTAKGNLVAAVNELDAEHGTIASLTTTAKNTFVAAINEIDASVTAAEATLASSLAQIMTFEIDALTAGNDLTGRVLAAMPTGYSFEILSADVISNGSPSGIDAGNTCVVAVKNQSDTVVTKTYDNVSGFPEDNAVSNLGTISATYKTIAAGSALSLYVTNGATAATPKFMLQITGKLIKAA